MEDALIVETTFLIDVEREAARRTAGPAQLVLEQHSQHRLYVTPIIAGELAAGTSMADRARWESFLAPFHMLPISHDVCWEYGRAFRHLQANGLLIGSNDLWIAAAGLAYGMPVVTRNARHFTRVPGLQVLSY